MKFQSPAAKKCDSCNEALMNFSAHRNLHKMNFSWIFIGSKEILLLSDHNPRLSDLESSLRYFLTDCRWTPSGCQFESDWKSFLSPELRSPSHQRVHWAIDWPVREGAHFRDLFLNTGFMLETRLNHAAPSSVEEEQLYSESLPNLRGRIQTPWWGRLCQQCFSGTASSSWPQVRGRRSINKLKALLSRTTEKAPKVVDVRQEVWLTKLKCWVHGRALTWYLVLTVP